MSSRFETYKKITSQNRELGTDLEELKNLYSLNKKFYSQMDFDEFIEYSAENAKTSYDKSVQDYINQPIPEDPLKKDPDYYKKLFTLTREEWDKENRGWRSLRRTVVTPYSETLSALLQLGARGASSNIQGSYMDFVPEKFISEEEKTKRKNKQKNTEYLKKWIDRKVNTGFREIAGTDIYETKIDKETGEKYYELQKATNTAESIARPVSELIAALAITKRPVGSLTKNMKDFGKIKPRGRGRPSKSRLKAESYDRIREGVLGFGQTLTKGEVAAQFAFVDDPEFMMTAEFLAKYVGDDDNKFADLINYLDVDEDSPEAARRLSLLLDGVVFGTAISTGIGAVKVTSTGVANLFKKIKSEGPEAVAKFKEMIGIARKSTEIPKTVKPKPAVNLITDWNNQIFKNNPIGRGLNTAQKEIQRFWFGLKSYGMHTPEAFKIIKMSEYSNKGWSKRALDLHAKLLVTMKKLSKDGAFKNNEIKELFEAYMTKGKYQGKKVTLKSLPEELQDTANYARKTIDNLGRQLLQSKNIPDELKKEINQNMGRYLRKTYEAFENPNYTPTQTLVDNARSELAIGLKLADEKVGKVLKTDEFYEQRADLQIKKWLDPEYTQKFSNMDNHINAVFGAKDAKIIFKERKNLMPSLEKLLAGDSVDITTQVFRTIETLAHQVNKYKMFDDLAEEGKDVWYFTDDAIAPDVRMLQGKIEGEAFGALNGVRTTKEIAELFAKMQNAPMTGRLTRAYGYFLQTKGLGQAFATVYNLTTHVRNTIGGGWILLRNGHNPFGRETINSLNILDNYLGVSKTLTRGEQDTVLNDMYTDLLKRGVINQNVKVGDFKALINELNKNSSSSIDAVAGNIFNRVYNATKNFNKFTTDVYVAEDDLWRIVAYNKELNTLKRANAIETSKKSLEVLKSEAADIVRNTMPTYDLISPSIQGLKKLPIGNFFSFHAEMFRNNYHTTIRSLKEISSGNAILTERGMTRLAGQISTTYIGAKGATDLTKYYFGISDEEEQAIRDLDIAPWSKNSALVFNRDEKGNIEVIDLTYTDPSAPVTDVARAFLQDIVNPKNPAETEKKILAGTYEAAKQFLKPFLSPAIVTESSLAMLFGGRDYETGEYLDGFNPQEGLSIGNLMVIMKHVGSDLIPREIKDDYSLIYGKKADKIKEGELSLPNELFAKVTGQRVKVLDEDRLEKDFMYKMYELKVQHEIGKNNINSYIKKDVPAEKLLQEIEEGYKAYYPEFVKAKLAFEAAYTLGVPKKTIDDRINTTFKRTFTNKEIVEMSSFTNSFIPIRLTDADLKRFDKLGDFSNMSKLEFAREYQELYSYYSHLPIITQDKYKWNNPDLVPQYERTFPEPRIKRKQKVTGGPVRQQYFKGEQVSKDFPVTDVKEIAADRVDPFTGMPYADQMDRLGFSQGGNIDEVLAKQLFNIDAKWQRNHEAESADLVNRKIDEGIFPERARIPVNPHTGWVEMTNQTDEEIFNKVNHQRLAYKLGDSNLKFAGLQVREGLSIAKDVAGRVSGKNSKDNFKRKLLDSQLDFLNNRVGFNLRKKGLTLEEAENEIVNNTIIDFNLQPKELGL